MDIIYYSSVLAVMAALVAGMIGLIRPNLLKALLKHHATRSRILAGSIAAVFILAMVVSATEPLGVKQARLAEQAAAAAAEKTKEAFKTPSAGALEPSRPKVETETVTETEVIAFGTEAKNDGTLAKGTTKVTQEGKSGVRSLTYIITLTDGKETKRELKNDEVTRRPVPKIIAYGTYAATQPAPKPVQSSSGCDPNYSGACVPIASDVDCGGGSGNGPAYVYGVVNVIGKDIYDLDRNGDGYGCE
jgi:uncharacterized membrane protein YuzA (DUF378 family)